MDFLDPRRKRFQLFQLMAGYLLTAIAIGLGTLVLVYAAYGYSVNTKTGDIVENGLLFVDSKPGGATIYLNNKPINQTTSARLVLPAGNYDLKLSREGYKDWERKFALDEHSIKRYVYPFLYPKEPKVTAMKTYTSLPQFFTESPDRHWLIVRVPNADSSVVSFDQYDTGDLKKPPVTLTIPTSLMTAPGKLTEVEWSTDNKHILLQNTFTGGSEYIVFNRDTPTTSYNVTKVFKISPTDVAFKNKKSDQLYLLDKVGGNLRLGNVNNASLSNPIIKNVLAFKPYGNNIINYVVPSKTVGKAQARIWSNNKTYPLYTFKSGNKYILDAAGYQGSTYFFAGSDAQGQFNIYKNPLSDLQNPSIARAVPVMGLHAAGAEKGGFSSNTRFIAIEGRQSFAVYDLETQERYEYSLKNPLSGPMHWMDGHRLIGNSINNVFVMDYDNSNVQSLTPSASPLGGYFDRDYNRLFTLAPINGSTTVSLNRVDMRAGSDLPKSL